MRLTRLRRQIAADTAHMVRMSVENLAMANCFRRRLLFPMAALGITAMLGGCVAYPAYPAYYGYPYYGPGVGIYFGRGFYYGGGRWRR